ncbi:hypothetical protein BJ170DRAFT_591712 [Xylariales sp. AK1849]|nr:hypothetical protein BJ170DRAFT_591712 [Xylariales sp. AK1849]
MGIQHKTSTPLKMEYKGTCNSSVGSLEDRPGQTTQPDKSLEVGTKPSSRTADITRTNIHSLNGGSSPVGEHSSRRQAINAFKPFWQIAPIRWMDRIFPNRRQRIVLFVGMWLSWCLAFVVLLDNGTGPINVDGAYLPVRQLSCTDSFWLPDNGCGIDGVDCRDANSERDSMAFHCPSDCGSVRLPKPHLVGPQEIVDRPLVIGGPIYRADSWICASAIHADIISDSTGTCGVVTRMPQTNTFPGSTWNGISSATVRTYFPTSFKFRLDSGFDCQVNDRRWLLPYVSMAFTALIFLFSASAGVPFFTALAVGFIHVNFVTNADDSGLHPSTADNKLTFRSIEPPFPVLNNIVPIFLCAALIYGRSVRRSLHRLTAQLEKTALWLGGFWVGIFPIHALGSFVDPSLGPRSMGMPYRAMNEILLCIIAVHHLYHLHLEGRLSRSLPLYCVFLLALLTSTFFPDIPIPFHFYILALLLLPGSGIQGRPSILYQGLLLGLFVHGIAKDGFIPNSKPSQSPGLLDPSLYSLPGPEILDPTIHRMNAYSNITFTWKTPVPPEVDGISMLVNDIERARRHFGEGGKEGGGSDIFEWVRGPQAVPDYMRFSWVKGDEVLGYDKAGVWEVEGEWSGLGGAGV